MSCMSSILVLSFLTFTQSLVISQTATKAPAAKQNQPAGDWVTYNRNYEGDRYSPLNEITPDNIAKLQPICTYDSGEKVSFETGPIVIQGTLYFTTLENTYAIDAATCQLKWKHAEKLTAAEKAGLGVHRGVGYANGKVFRGFNNGNAVAIDTASGKTLWSAKIADPANGESIPISPIAWGGLVFIGNAGGDNYGVTGRIYALDENTGKQAWKFDVVPTTGPAANTWLKKSATNPPTGGATWTTYSIDPATGALFVPTGNVAPDFILELHPGDNLYTSSVLAIDAKTGKLLQYVQPYKNDFHDWDVASAPAIINTRAGKKLAVAASKDGLVYGIDRHQVSGSLNSISAVTVFPILYKTPATTRSNISAPLTSTKATRFCPGSQGGAEWNGPAYLPSQNMIYVPEIDWCTSVTLAPVAQMKGGPGKSWSGANDAGFGKQDPISQWAGWITALDADTGKVAWKYKAATPVVAAVTPTQAGLVFSADMLGTVFALDAKSGNRLWAHKIGEPVGGGVVSYEAGGHQHIAVAAGLNSPIWPKKGTSARIVVYGLK